MRNLRRNTTRIWYAHMERQEAATDGGYRTLDYTPVYSAPAPLWLTLTGESGGWNGAETGEYRPAPFGMDSDFVRTGYYYGSQCPIQTGDAVWVEIDVAEKHNYEVVRIGRFGGTTTIALRQVNMS